MSEIDQLQDYWDARPCNVRHSPEPVGTREYFDGVTRRRYFVEPHARDFAEFQKWRGKRVLEIGCGIGTDAEQFARWGAHYTGVELSENSMALAKRRFEIYELRGRFIHGDAERLDELLERQTYDLIYSWGVLHHTPNPRRVVDQVVPRMHARSELRVMVYAANSWKAAMIAEGLDQPEAQAGCPLARTYTPDTLRKLLDGFHVQDITQDHVFPYRVEDYTEYRYVRQPWFEAMPPDVFGAMEKHFGWHLMARAKL